MNPLLQALPGAILILLIAGIIWGLGCFAYKYLTR